MDITTQDEQDFLANTLSTVGSKDVWIGLTSSANSKSLIWTDGSALSFTAWDKNGRDENESCVRMVHYHSYKWGDRPCSTKFGYVCEFE